MSLLVLTALASVAGAASLPAPRPLSSHREAPNVTRIPKVDGTDFYLFRSYEPGREDHVVLVANYLPLQDPYGGPNYFSLDPRALYEIHVDNDGDGEEEITFQFRFDVQSQPITLGVGNPGQEVDVAIPLVNVGPIGAGNSANLNVSETYSARVVLGDRRTGAVHTITNADTGAAVFVKPVDNIGAKSIPDYPAYAGQYVYEIALPGGATGRMFVGQRKDPFVVNLGETFDLINLDPTGAVDAESDDLADKNVTALILEIPISFLTAGSEPVIGGWTTASLRQATVRNPAPGPASDATVDGGAFVQVSRLGMPLVNEVVIGLPDKDRFNASEPSADASFLTYVTNPTFPELVQVLFPVSAPNLFPRTDLVAVFLTGIGGLNQPANVVASEMLRLNTATPVTPAGSQSNLGVIGGDAAGFPNGRRPGDDVVDVVLRAAMGVLLDAADAPDGQIPYTDGALVDESFFDTAFPFLRTPLAGSPSQ